MATKAKWYQIVAEKMRVSPISNIRPENVIRNTPAWSRREVRDVGIRGQ